MICANGKCQTHMSEAEREELNVELLEIELLRLDVVDLVRDMEFVDEAAKDVDSETDFVREVEMLPLLASENVLPLRVGESDKLLVVLRVVDRLPDDEADADAWIDSDLVTVPEKLLDRLSDGSDERVLEAVPPDDDVDTLTVPSLVADRLLASDKVPKVAVVEGVALWLRLEDSVSVLATDVEKEGLCVPRVFDMTVREISLDGDMLSETE